MTASQVAARVLRWALDPHGPVPSGSLDDIAALAQPGDELRALAGAVAARNLARLRWHAPPLGDARPPRGDLPLLAVLVTNPAATHPLVSTLETPVSRWDWVARDAIIEPALQTLAGRHPPRRPTPPATPGGPAPAVDHEALERVFADELRRRSPLTALRSRPAPGDEDRGLAWLIELAGHRDGRRWLCRTLASPVCAPDVLAWRTQALDRLRLDPELRPLVLDVYATALEYHADALALWTTTAHRALTSQHDPLLAWALTLGRWWGVLVQVDRVDPEAIRTHQAIDPVAIRAGRALAAATRGLTGAT